MGTESRDPICVNSCDHYVGGVSWPADLKPGSGGPSASTYVCANERHQADAAEWVESVTGRRGVFVPWAPLVQDTAAPAAPASEVSDGA